MTLQFAMISHQQAKETFQTVVSSREIYTQSLRILLYRLPFPYLNRSKRYHYTSTSDVYPAVHISNFRLFYNKKKGTRFICFVARTAVFNSCSLTNFIDISMWVFRIIHENDWRCTCKNIVKLWSVKW